MSIYHYKYHTKLTLQRITTFIRTKLMQGENHKMASLCHSKYVRNFR